MKIKLANIFNIFHIKKSDFKSRVLEILWYNKSIRILLIIALLINFVNWSISFFINLKIREDVIALHHNIYFGINLIGSPKQIYFIPLLGLMIIIINFIFSYLIKEEDNFFVYIFTASALLVNVFLLLGLGSVMLINFR